MSDQRDLRIPELEAAIADALSALGLGHEDCAGEDCLAALKSEADGARDALLATGVRPTGYERYPDAARAR